MNFPQSDILVLQRQLWTGSDNTHNSTPIKKKNLQYKLHISPEIQQAATRSGCLAYFLAITSPVPSNIRVGQSLPVYLWVNLQQGSLTPHNGWALSTANCTGFSSLSINGQANTWTLLTVGCDRLQASYTLVGHGFLHFLGNLLWKITDKLVNQSFRISGSCCWNDQAQMYWFFFCLPPLHFNSNKSMVSQNELCIIGPTEATVRLHNSLLFHPPTTSPFITVGHTLKQPLLWHCWAGFQKWLCSYKIAFSVTQKMSTITDHS